MIAFARFIAEHRGEFETLLLQHVLLVITSTAAAIAVGVPVGILADKRERRRALAATLGGLERHILAFMQLPLRSLDEISLRERLKELGQGVGTDNRAPSPNVARQS